jgi:hypothetical protein
MVFGGLNLFANKEEIIKQIDNHDAHDDHEQDNKNKHINNDGTSSANTATANSDKLGDAAALKNHNMECKQTKDSAPPSSPNSQQSKQDATTSNVEKCSSMMTVTTEATKQKSTSSESASTPAGVVQGLCSMLKGVLELPALSTTLIRCPKKCQQYLILLQLIYYVVVHLILQIQQLQKNSQRKQIPPRNRHQRKQHQWKTRNLLLRWMVSVNK